MKITIETTPRFPWISVSAQTTPRVPAWISEYAKSKNKRVVLEDGVFIVTP
ncbi:MAG: hypothetical protein ACMG6S_31265 [Byssovorax sp.]